MASQVSTPGSAVLPFSVRASRASVRSRWSWSAALARDSAERRTPAPSVIVRWIAKRASGASRGCSGVSGYGTGCGTRAWRPFAAREAAMSSTMRSA